MVVQFSKCRLAALVLGSSMLAGTFAHAQGSEMSGDPFASPSPEATQKYEYHADTRAIIHQKAAWNAQQRMSRLAAMRWYGMYNARPTASATPFTSMYSPAWQMPGGRPFAWHQAPTTVIVHQQDVDVYR